MLRPLPETRAYAGVQITCLECVFDQHKIATLKSDVMQCDSWHSAPALASRRRCPQYRASLHASCLLVANVVAEESGWVMPECYSLSLIA